MAVSVADGLTVPKWEGRKARQALALVKAEGERARSPCFLCLKRIDYKLRYPHPYSCSVEHIRSRERYPLLTWDPANWAPSHLQCNVERRRRAAVPAELPELGVTSQEW